MDLPGPPSTFWRKCSRSIQRLRPHNSRKRSLNSQRDPAALCLCGEPRALLPTHRSVHFLPQPWREECGGVQIGPQTRRGVQIIPSRFRLGAWGAITGKKWKETPKKCHKLEITPLHQTSTDPMPDCCGMIWTPPHHDRSDSGIIWTPLCRGWRCVVSCEVMRCTIRECIWTRIELLICFIKRKFPV